MQALCERLQSTWHKGIPITAAMGAEIESFADGELVVRAALAPNINVHGTAFAGSLYAISALTCWSMVWLQLEMRGLSGEILLAEGHISYRQPVAETIVCRCRLDAQSARPAVDRFEETGKAVFKLRCVIGARGADAAAFDGRYVVLPRHA
jgi:thioesterase domain-containing protein